MTSKADSSCSSTSFSPSSGRFSMILAAGSAEEEAHRGQSAHNNNWVRGYSRSLLSHFIWYRCTIDRNLVDQRPQVKELD
ncbi:hypothetical protein EON65_18155 [archaeon]|nr:MAG: hypothetical protein EON65_18155 [archaeon]